MNLENLNSFLTIGCYLDYKNDGIAIDVSNIDKQKYENVDKKELIKIGAELWRESIFYNFQDNQQHSVPISEGLDSRAVLEGLLEYTEVKNIHTSTIGTPNALDYDIGKYVAKKIGTQHISFYLTKHTYKQNEIEDISKRIQYQAVLFHHWPVWEVDKRFNGCIQWSVYFGETLTGNHMLATPSFTIEEARKQFIKKNSYAKSIDLTNGSDFSNLIECNCISKDDLTLDEQLDFQNRQTKYIAPIVLMKGYDYKTPFLCQSWIDFILSVSSSLRKDQALYKKYYFTVSQRNLVTKQKQTLDYLLKHLKMQYLLKEWLINF